MRKALTNSQWLRTIKQTLKLNQFQEFVLIGTLLGDGYLRLSRSGKSARLQICHSQKAKDYLYWLYGVFKPFIFSQPDFQISNQALRFTTISHPDFLKFQQLFYQNNSKIIPDNIKQLLYHPLSLAVWFMDDGNGYQKSSAYRISTYAFKLKGNHKLIECLNANFNIKANLIHDSKGYQIYIPAKNGNASKFLKLVEPYIISSMKYKL